MSLKIEDFYPPLKSEGINTAKNIVTTGTITAANITTTTSDVSLSGTLAVTGTTSLGTAEAVAIKGIYAGATVSVAVPTIADAESDEVVVDVSAAFTMAPAVGNEVLAIPLVALPTDCLLNGAYVSNTDTITVSFGTKEGGSGVTGANKNFKFVVIDLT